MTWCSTAPLFQSAGMELVRDGAAPDGRSTNFRNRRLGRPWHPRAIHFADFARRRGFASLGDECPYTRPWRRIGFPIGDLASRPRQPPRACTAQDSRYSIVWPGSKHPPKASHTFSLVHGRVFDGRQRLSFSEGQFLQYLTEALARCREARGSDRQGREMGWESSSWGQVDGCRPRERHAARIGKNRFVDLAVAQIKSPWRRAA